MLALTLALGGAFTIDGVRLVVFRTWFGGVILRGPRGHEVVLRLGRDVTLGLARLVYRGRHGRRVLLGIKAPPEVVVQR